VKEGRKEGRREGRKNEKRFSLLPELEKMKGVLHVYRKTSVG